MIQQHSSLRRPYDSLFTVILSSVFTRNTPGYCWRTSFKVLEVPFLAHISRAFWPSKKACWIDKFRHCGVRQQYPPVISTHAAQPHPGTRPRTETQSINQRRVGRWPGSFWTACERAHLVATPWLPPLKLKRHHAIIDGPGFESAQARCFDHLASRRAQRGLPMLPIIHSVINSG